MYFIIRTVISLAMELEKIAPQLKQPKGEFGIEVGEKMNEANAYMSTHTYNMLEIKKEDKIFEVGFGNGHFIPYILNKAEQVSYAGIDISQTMVDEASKKNALYIKQGTVELINANVSKIPFDNNTFDKVCTVNTLYFWENPEKDMKELCRILKPGGKLIVAVRPLNELQRAEFEKHGFNFYPSKTIRTFMENAGLRFVESIIKNDPPEGFIEDLKERNSQYIIAIKD